MDLINMQSQSFNDFRYIMNYQDHVTKFVILRPLKTKRAEEIYFNIMDIYIIKLINKCLFCNNCNKMVREG
jgi:hypothetical protein